MSMYEIAASLMLDAQLCPAAGFCPTIGNARVIVAMLLSDKEFSLHFVTVHNLGNLYASSRDTSLSNRVFLL